MPSKYLMGLMFFNSQPSSACTYSYEEPSILNQCNTIFAFQAYDETGFEFMKNYMGHHHVRALPNLGKRQGVIVGKASVSERPVIVRMHDQQRSAASAEPGFFERPSTQTSE